VALFPDSTRKNGVLVMCEVYNADGTAHASNDRATILDDPDAWFGFEQEYFLYQDGRPLGFPENGYPAPQGPYYTGVGYKNVGDIARQIVEAHSGHIWAENRLDDEGQVLGARFGVSLPCLST
jgi:glutamine synthetase